LQARPRIHLVHIASTGIPPASVDHLSGQIQAITASMPATLPYLAQGRLRVLAVPGPKRAALLPDVPTWKESGIVDAEVVNYWGIVAPAGTSREVVLRLNTEVARALTQPDVK